MMVDSVEKMVDSIRLQLASMTMFHCGARLFFV
jgi:hypothetical protein